MSGKTLTINEKRLDFQHEIKETIEMDGILIVLVWNVSTGKIKEQPINNVYAINQTCTIIWNLKDIIGKDGLYTLIRKDEQNKLVAVEFMGMNYIIDIKNRKIIGGRASK